MDRVTNLTALVQQEVASYAIPSPTSAAYYMENKAHNAFSVIAVPNDRTRKTVVILMARLDNDKIIVEFDMTNKPLYESLMRAGIPRDQIILAYQGEPIPA